MIKSMTGFGRGENTDGIYNFSVEIKTINHRYNDIIIKMPRHIGYLEEKIKSVVKSKINRGRVDIYINLEHMDDSQVDVKINIPLAKAYKSGLDTLLNELKLMEEIKLSHILGFSDIIEVDKKQLDEDAAWDCLHKALELALDDIMDMRIKEGLVLKEDMETQIIKIDEMISGIEKRAPLVVLEYREKLNQRIRELLSSDCTIDKERLNQEVALFADKSNINEEIVRLRSHIKQFIRNFEEDEPVGRKLDFLIQEMNRETNTIGSKANDLDICNYVVEIKSQLEKIKEQIQNIE